MPWTPRPFRVRVARRVLLLFLACALVPIAAMGLLPLGKVRTEVADQARGRLRQTGSEYAQGVYARLLVAERSLKIYAQALPPEPAAPLPPPPPEFDRVSRVVLQPAPAEASPGGATRAEPPPSSAEALFLGQPALAHLARGEALVLPRRGPEEPVSLALRAEGPGLAAGALRATVNPAYLWGDPESFPFATSFCAVDAGGLPLYCPPAPPADALSRAVALARQQSNGDWSWSEGGQEMLASFRLLFMMPKFGTPGWVVVAAQPTRHALAAAGTFERGFVPVVILGLLIAMLLGLTQVRRTLGPLARLIEGTRRLSARDFAARVEVDGQGEFAELAGAFNRMAGRLQGQFAVLSTLAEVDRLILSRLELDPVLELLAARFIQCVPAEAVAIVARSASDAARARVCVRERANDSAPRPVEGPWVHEGVRQPAAAPGASWIGADALPQQLRNALKASPARWFAPIQVMSRGTCCAVVYLGLAERDRLDPDAVDLVQGLCDRLAVAISSAARDEQLVHQARHDVLTGLPNRFALLERLGEEIARAHRERRGFALLFVDLDRFKNVNDDLGHAAGDLLVRQAAQRLRGCVRDIGEVARLGGDEFMLLLPDLDAPREIDTVTARLLESLSQPFLVHDQEVLLTASIGVARYPHDARDAEALLGHADAAMYRAKSAGRAQAAYFDKTLNQQNVARVRLEKELRHALERDELFLVYQPQVNAQTLERVGVEALVRWRHPTRGIVSPSEFIDLAEESGLIESLGLWTLRTACWQWKAWADAGVAPPVVAVNVSPRQFRQERFFQDVFESLACFEVPPSALELEITEGVLLGHSEDVLKKLRRLCGAGVRIAIDDFGTGYSSLAYLRRLPVQTIKIDRSFVKDTPGDAGSCAIVGATVGLGHALGKTIVAEGVETAEQLAFMREAGCDAVQGFLISRPVPPHEIASPAAPAVEPA